MWKVCNCCNVRWEDHHQFLEDSGIRYIGMQLDLENPRFPCVYFFDHARCGTTLVLNIRKFEDMIDETIPELTMAGGKNCPRHCADMENLLDCDNECHNAPFRRFAIGVLKKNQ